MFISVLLYYLNPTVAQLVVRLTHDRKVAGSSHRDAVSDPWTDVPLMEKRLKTSLGVRTLVRKQKS